MFDVFSKLKKKIIISEKYMVTSNFLFSFYLIQYLFRDIQFSRASLNGALTQHKTNIET